MLVFVHIGLLQILSKGQIPKKGIITILQNDERMRDKKSRIKADVKVGWVGLPRVQHAFSQAVSSSETELLPTLA
jgi:hypothetical protein